VASVTARVGLTVREAVSEATLATDAAVASEQQVVVTVPAAEVVKA